MPLPPAGNVVRLRHLFNFGNPQPVGFRIFMAYTGGPPTNANLVTLASQADVKFNASLASLMATGIQLVTIIADDLSVASGATGTWTGSSAGTRTGTIPTDSTAALVELGIARRYRGGKPKVFTPFGVAADLSNPNAWSSAFQSALVTGWNSYITGLAAITGIGITLTTQQNVSYFKGSQANPNPSKWAKKNVPLLRGTPVLDPIVSVGVRLTPGVQRRRRGSS